LPGAEAKGVLSKVASREPEPRIGGVQGNAERLGHLGDGKTVYLVHQEHGAPVDVERFERRVGDAERLGRDDPLEGCRSRFGAFVRFTLQLVAMTRAAPIVRRLAKGETEEPSANGSRGIVAVAPAIDLEEHVVSEIFEIASGNSEAAERMPDVREMLGE
jgi:hypothetical protein